MSMKHLGPEFEIHGGGLDLVFPHHENEIAQSRALGHPFARLWVHNGMLRFRGEEMHKSLGNDISLKAALDEWGRETLLVFFLRGHWRKPLDYSRETLQQAAATADGLREVFRNPSQPAPAGAWDEFEVALEDDFNTAEALAVMHSWRDHELLSRALDVFGLGSLAHSEEAPAEIRELAERRREVRATGDFGEGDRLREEIEAAGWAVRDVAGGFQLVPKR
jgi:cysteinyl-tRNA synthetase